MKNKRIFMRICFILVLVFYQGLANGQDITVTGTVTDNANNEPLPGVAVVVKGTTIGTATDLNGKYSLRTQANAVLVFSYVGYEKQEIPVNGRSVVDVALKTSSEQLEEVVVIGYGTTKKADLTGSVTTVSSKDFNKGVISSPQELLVGKTPGVVITTSNGAPGSGSTIKVRGGSSLYASNSPLVIVDGVPLDNNNV